MAAVALDPTAVRVSLDRWSAAYGIDPHLARALAWMESGFNPALVSSAGARGVLQLLPDTWSYVEDTLLQRQVEHTPDGQVQVGLAFLRQLLKEFGGDERLALAAWYQGPAAVRQKGVYPESHT